MKVSLLVLHGGFISGNGWWKLKMRNRSTYWRYSSTSWDVLLMVPLWEYQLELATNRTPWHKMYICGISHIFLLSYTYRILFCLFSRPNFYFSQNLCSHFFPYTSFWLDSNFTHFYISKVRIDIQLVALKCNLCFAACRPMKMISIFIHINVSVSQYRIIVAIKSPGNYNIMSNILWLWKLTYLKFLPWPLLVCTLTYGYTPKARTINM